MDVTVREAKAQLSRLLRRVEAGESITIHRGRHPVAMLVPMPARSRPRQIWGNLSGSLGAAFDEPLPGVPHDE